MSSHSNPQRFPKASLGDKVGLAVLPLVLVAALLSAAGCAGPQVYVPFEQKTQESAATRWQALENLAKRDQWNVVLANKGYTMIAYRDSTGTSGVRDRIKVELFPDRTVVETQTEIEDRGLWQASEGRCENYTFSREKLLAEQIQSRGEPAGSASAARGAPSREGLARPSEASGVGVAGGGPKGEANPPRVPI